jgi:6-phosphogluconate dehydrogenase
MQLGMIGLGRMGGAMVRRLIQAGHTCHIYDHDAPAMTALADVGAVPASSLEQLCAELPQPRIIWIMVPAAIVSTVVATLRPLLSAGDIVVDGGNSYYKETIRTATMLANDQIHFMDCGTSGGVWGLERGYCLMLGGDQDAFTTLEPILQALAPGVGTIPRTQGCQGDYRAAEQGYLYCGTSGAGHFVKMVHNGIEYGLMAAYAEGFNLLRHAGIGHAERVTDAETAPLADPDHFPYLINVADVAELWRRGSVVSSWLLDLIASALQADPNLNDFSGHVADSGEGRWTSIAAIESGTPLPVLTTALFERFSSRGEADFADQLLSAMRYQFGGHQENKD